MAVARCRESPIELRKLILAVLLASLALSAIAGVVAALLSNDDVVVRVMWTGFATTFMAAVGLAFSSLLPRERTRPAGLFGLALLVLQFLLVIVLIWFEPILPSGRQEDLGLTMLFAGLVGVPVMVCVLFIRIRAARVAGIVGIVAGAASFAALLMATWQPTGVWGVQDEWAGTGGVLAGIGVILIAGLFGVGRDGATAWITVVRAAAALLGLMTLVVSLTAIWGRGDPEELICLTLTLAMLAAFINLLELASLHGRQRWVRWTSLGAATITVLCVNMLVFTDGALLEDFFGRLATAAGIVTASGAMAVLVLVAFNRRMEIGHRTATLMTLTIVCPRCRRKQAVAVGGSACSGCGLRMHIRIEEPACPGCGYLLHQLTSDRCPECGREIGTEGAGHEA